MDLEQQAVEFMSTSAVASRSQRQKVSVMLRTIGFALPSTAESWPMVLGMEKKKFCCNIVVFSWVATVGLIVQETVQGAMDKSQSLSRPPWSSEQSKPSAHGESLGIRGLVWVCCLGPTGSGGTGESHLLRPAVLSLSC